MGITIGGFIPLLLAGLLGAGLHEGLKIAAAWKSSGAVNGLEVGWSAILVAAGGLVPLFYGLDERPFLEIANLAVGIPALISAGFAVSTASPTSQPTDEQESEEAIPRPSAAGARRTVPQFLGWRF